VTVADLGAGTNPDPRADVTVDKHTEADIQADLTEAWPFDTSELHGVILTHVLEHLPDTTHIFQEAGRVLETGGWLEITVPIGADIQADPTHEHAWTWATPKAYCRNESQPWQPTTDFQLVDRDLDAWFFAPLQALNPLLSLAANRWPAEVAERATSGELTAVYLRCPQ
jgi:SAM-dependent methyltransferase